MHQRSLETSPTFQQQGQENKQFYSVESAAFYVLGLSTGRHVIVDILQDLRPVVENFLRRGGVALEHPLLAAVLVRLKSLEVEEVPAVPAE